MTKFKSLSAPEFGMPVTLAQADKYFAAARKIEKESEAKIKQLFENNPEAKAYYGSPAYGFVFSKESIEGLLAKMTSDDHYLIMLQGAKTIETISADKVGRRTLIAMVYRAKSDGDENHDGVDAAVAQHSSASPDSYADTASTKTNTSTSSATLELDESEFVTPLGSGSGGEHPGVIVMVANDKIPRNIDGNTEINP